MSETHKEFPPVNEVSNASVPTLLLTLFDVGPGTMHNQVPELETLHRSPGTEVADAYHSGLGTFTESMQYHWIKNNYEKEKWFKGAKNDQQQELQRDAPEYRELPKPELTLALCDIYEPDEPMGKFVQRVQKDALTALDEIYKRQDPKVFNLSMAAFHKKFAPGKLNPTATDRAIQH